MNGWAASFCWRMTLYKYFKRVESSSTLPGPEGPLSASSSILAADQEVKPLLERSKDDSPLAAAIGKKHGQYKHYTTSEKTRVAKRAAECGVTNTVRYFAKEFSDRPLSEGTVCASTRRSYC